MSQLSKTTLKNIVIIAQLKLSTYNINMELTLNCFNDLFESKNNRKPFTEIQLQSIIGATLAISKEIKFEHLIKTLLEISLNLTGAQRAVLVLEITHEKFIVAEIVNQQGHLRFFQPNKAEISNTVPLSILEFCQKNKKPILSTLLKANNPIFQDIIFKDLSSLSFMAVPIMKSELVQGFFYIEQNCSVHALDTAHLEMIRIISTQAAVSLENARLYENLNTEIKVRTLVENALQLSEKKLNNALNASEAANIAKNQFIANMSHEIRTPLNGILGIAELLQDQNLSIEDRSRYTEIIHESGSILLSILNDILDLSKIEAGKITIQNEVFIPAQIVKSAAKLYTKLADRKNIKLILEIHKHSWQSYIGDPGRIRQILTNLISNSIKFTESGQIIIRSFVEDNVLRIEVSDTGIGIGKDFQASLFQKFTQVDQSTSRKHMGTGLGLSIAKQLCQLMVGQIGVDSELNKGSTFWFEIPLKPLFADLQNFYPENNIQTEKKEQFITQKEMPSLKILIVEDNQINAIVAGKMLNKLGHTFDVATNGKEAVEAVKKIKYDTILMDCQMPEMDGYEATKMIRFWETETKQSPLKIIALTAAIFPDEVERCYASGMDHFLRKPINLKTLSENLIF
jgi:signal transduction histidine kinase/CheY-like chemotaxis protein